ncbi:MAG: flagellar motor switch protein FliM [Proteobacteria bacterium]|nr:flagellar motor switch protein FliM [Pseudomonadota bacterium]
MPEVLSQSEIDSLLSAVSTGAVESDSGKADQANPKGGKATSSASDWIAYDLTSQEKIVRGRLVALQGIHERFARLFRVSLTNSLKKPVTVNFVRTDFVKAGDYLSNLMLPTSINIVSLKDLKGYLLFIVSSKLTYALVDAYYGGSERPFAKVGAREEFTNIENNMIQKISQIAYRDMEEAWKLNYPLSLQHQRTENNPHFVGTIHPSELVAVVTLDVEFENLTGPCVILLQLSALESIQEYLGFNITGEFSMDKRTWRKHWIKELLTCEMLLQVELGSATKTLGEMEQLKVGDVLTLTQDSVAPLDIYIQGQAKMKGLMGTFRGNSAVQVTTTLNSEDTGEGEYHDQRKVSHG